MRAKASAHSKHVVNFNALKGLAHSISHADTTKRRQK